MGTVTRINLDGTIEQFTEDLFVALPEIVEQSPQEIVVTPWQIRQALNELGLRPAVETLVHNTTNQDIKDGWEFASEWREYNPIIQQMASQLNLTESQIHAIFVLAKSK